jgi:hypothetical protein
MRTVGDEVRTLVPQGETNLVASDRGVFGFILL